MAKNTKQIALMQHRRGNQSELTDLHEGEFGLATDTNSLFIGNPNNPKLKERIQSNTFPYGNIQVLTEFSDNLEMIKYVFSNGSESNLPIIVTGSKLYPSIPAGTTIVINGQTITFDKETDAQGFCDIINSLNLDVKAQVVEGGKIQLISNGDTLVLENGEGQEQGGILDIIGITTDSSYTENANPPSDRTIQEVLDDYCSVKNFGVLGDGTTDDSDSFYNAILTVFCSDNKPNCYKTMLVPAGEYIINSKPIALPTGIHLKGEGIDRTIIKTNSYENGLNILLTTLDSNYVLSDLSATNKYGVNGEIAHNIIVEDMTFDVSESTLETVLLLGSTFDVWFKNVKFVGYSDVQNGNGSTLVNIYKTQGLQDSSHIHFFDCIFENGKNGVSISNNLSWFLFNNCLFKDITNQALNITAFNDAGKTSNGSFISNKFTNCSLGKNIITLSNRTEYLTFINTLFDKEVTETNTVATRFSNNSELNNIDTLDPEMSSKRIYQFGFYQPKWVFLDYLATPNGDYLVKGLYNTEIVNGQEIVKPLTNGLTIEQGDETNNNKVAVTGTNLTGDVSIGSGFYGHLELGGNSISYPDWEIGVEYNVNDYVQIPFEIGYKIFVCLQAHTSSTDITTDNSNYWKLENYYTPSILLDKTLDLNGNPIRSYESGQKITFQTTRDNYLVIDDSTHTGLSYAERIASDNDAIPNVEYVNKLASTENRLGIDYQAIQTINKTRIPLIFFDKGIYGDFVNLKQISINIRRPFYSIVNKINQDTLTWESNLSYAVGDIVKHNETYDGVEETYYYMCSQAHISSSSFDEDAGRTGKISMWEDVYAQGKDFDTGLTVDLKDIKYVSIVASNNEDSARLLFDRNILDVTKRDINGKYYQNWATSVEYKVGDRVAYQDRYYECKLAHTSSDAHELFNSTYWFVIPETGYDFIFNFERDLQKVNPTTFEIIADDTDYTLEYNFSDYTLYLELLDENMNLINKFIPLSNVDDSSAVIQVSTAGTILITVDYLRGKNNIIVE